MKYLLPTLVLLGSVVLAACAPAPPPAPPPTEASTSVRPGMAGPSDIRRAARTFVEVVDRVEPVAEQHCRTRRPSLNCDFLIVVDDSPNAPPNAFQTLDAAGRPIIGFTLSLIADVRNADELAFIMAHEAAHHIEGHLDRQRRNAVLGAEVFGRLAGVVGVGGADAIRTAQELGAAVGARTYSKEFELEADALGTVIAAGAGYNPLRGAEFFFRIPDPGDQFLGTHPPNADRVAVVVRTAGRLGF